MKERFFATNAQNDRSREPTPDKVGGDEFVILSETKDLDGGKTEERFFAEDAQNDIVASRHGSLPLRRGGQDGRASRVENRNPAYELPSTSSTTTWSPFSKEKAKDVRPLRKDGKNHMVAGRHGSLPLRRGTVRDRSLRKDNLGGGRAKERFFATEAQNDKMKERFFAKDAQNDKMKVRFFAKDAQNDRDRRTTPSLRDAPLPTATLVGSSTKEGVKGAGDEFVILSETKDLDGGKTEERFFAKEAQNDKSIRMTFVVVCLMLLFLVVSPVGAQEPTTRLFLNPTPLEIDTTISPTGVVTLEVADGVDIFAFDLFVQYDPSLLSVSQVALGDFLGEGLFCMDMVNEPGLVHYSCTRFGVNTGVTGSGVLLELTFEAFGQAGDTILSLANSQLFESQDAFLVDATLEDGAVSVRPYRTYPPLIITAKGQGMGAQQ